MRRYLVTGGAGFVGRHMVEALLKRGSKVRVLDNFSCASRHALHACRKKIELIEGDVRKPRDVRRAVRGVDAVFHFAALRSVVRSVENPLVSHEVNATGALLLLEESLKARVRHFIFTSTSAVYGAAVAAKQRENGALRPVSPYGIAKLAAEHYARYYFEAKKMPTTSVRIFNVYGPRQNPESKYSLAVPGILAKIKKNEPPLIDGSGKQTRDFIYIDDLLGALFQIAGNPKAYGKVYNLGAGHAISINKIVSALLRLTGSPLKAVYGPRRPGDPDRTCADISLIRRELGWRPRVSLEEGLKRAAEHYMAS